MSADEILIMEDDPKFNAGGKFDCRKVPTALTSLPAHSSPLGLEYFDGSFLVAQRTMLTMEEAILVVVSAGVLAALFAASQDPATKALLLLDPTNAGGQARSAAARVGVPVAALIAKPQICNAWRNIDPALETLLLRTSSRSAMEDRQ